MRIYFICFFVSLLIAALAAPIDNRIIKFVVRMLSVTPLALIAGLRDLTVGTDIINYGQFNFEVATRASKLSEYISYIKSANGVENGYSILNYVVSRFTSSINVFFFVLNFLTLLFLVLGLTMWDKKISFSFALFVYYTLFWGITLNVMRQSLAATILFWGFSLYLKNKKIVPFVLIVILAAEFHQTALLGVLFPIIEWCVRKTIEKRKGIMLITVNIFIGIVLILLFNPNNSLITTIMGKLPLLGKYYLIFMKGGLDSITVGAGVPLRGMVRQIIPMGVPIGILWLRGKNDSTIDGKFDYTLINFLYLSVVFVLVSANSGVLSRLGMYFSIFQVVAIPYAARKEYGVNRIFVTIFFILYLLLVCALVFRSGNGDVYPYTSQLLNSFLEDNF